MTSVHNTDHAQVPQKSDIDNFVSMVGLDLLSNRSYHVWVQDKVALGEIWAIQMQVSFKLVTDFINYWCDYMEVISRRRNSGMSDFCKILPHSLPISKNQMNLKIYMHLQLYKHKCTKCIKTFRQIKDFLNRLLKF